MGDKSYVLQSYVTQEYQGNIFYLRMLCYGEKAISKFRLILEEFELTTKYFNCIMVDDESRKFKIQTMIDFKDIDESKRFADVLLKRVKESSELDFVSKIDEDFVLRGHFEGGSIDYPIISFSKPTDNHSRGIFMGSLWKYIYFGLDSRTLNKSRSEMFIRKAGYIQGRRIAKIITNNVKKELKKNIADISFEDKQENISSIKTLLESYSYAVIDLESITWDEEKEVIDSFDVLDSFFFRKDRESGFLQGLFTGIFINVLTESIDEITMEELDRAYLSDTDSVDEYYHDIGLFGDFEEKRHFELIESPFNKHRSDTFKDGKIKYE